MGKVSTLVIIIMIVSFRVALLEWYVRMDLHLVHCWWDSGFGQKLSEFENAEVGYSCQVLLCMLRLLAYWRGKYVCTDKSRFALVDESFHSGPCRAIVPR